MLATLSRDEHEIYLVIANGSWTNTVPCHAMLRGFQTDQASGVAISNDKLDGKPLLQTKQDAVSDFPVSAAGKEVNCTVPPHSVVFVKLVGGLK